MSLLIVYGELFAPYTEDGHTLESAIRYWKKVAGSKGISMDVVELAMGEIFNRVANGYEFPKDHCPCGCGIDKAATALIHAVRDRMLEIDDKIQIKTAGLMEDRYARVIEDQMRRVSKTNKQYVKMMRPPLRERSPVLRWTIKLWQLIFSR
jgi:hypothetical protein